MADENLTADTGTDEKELNTVRDILFGAKTREHEQRFDEMRNLWTSSLNEARGEFRERLDALEKDSKKQVHDILEKIELEHAAWQDRAIEMKQKLQDLYQDHEGKLNELRTMEANLIKTHQESLSEWLKRLQTATMKSDEG
jgi:predicted membrane chloride channel (bestrophin family)